MSIEEPTPEHRALVPRIIRRSAVFVILGWLVFTLCVSFFVPWLETVGRQHSVPLAPRDAPAVQAMQRMGKDFKESDSDSFAMLVLEGQQPLGEDAHVYYNKLIRELKSDPKHIQHVQDLWSDRLTAASVQSSDGKAVYVQLNLAGNQGTTLGQDSIAAVRGFIARTPPPPGIQAFVTGPAALLSDMQTAGDSSILQVTLVGAAIIFVMLLIVYRSPVTVIVLLVTVATEVFAARGIIAFMGDHNMVALSTFATNLLVALAMAAGTDYAIFFFGRYQEARQIGESREMAYYTTYRSVAPVVLGSGLTIAGAMLCLSFTRMPIFQTIGVPCAVGMLVSVVIALTLTPAVLTIGSGLGQFDPKRKLTVRGWRRIGTAIVRWPAPILATSCAIALIGIATLPGYKVSYDDRQYMPKDIPANLGYAAAERHFSQSRMMPEILMIEANHDMRNPTDFLTLHKVAKNIFHVHGISRVQGITRPEGTPIEHTSIPFLLSMQNAGQMQDMVYMRQRSADMLRQVASLKQTIVLMTHMMEITAQLNNTIHDMTLKVQELTDNLDDINVSLSTFVDFFRPIESYFYWEKHCYDIPVCWSIRSIFDTLEGVDDLDEKLHDLTKNLWKLDKILPQMLAAFPVIIDNMHDTVKFMETNNSTMTGMLDQMHESQQQASEVGQAFDQAKNDDSFWLPPEVFQNPDFKRAMTSFFSPDGKSVRFIISHRGDPASVDGIARIDRIRTAAEEALKTTPLEDAKIFVAGNASTYKDFRDGSKFDLLIAGVGSLCLIFIIMILITRSFVAALVIVGTVALSLGSSFGLSVLVWQYILGVQLHWMVIAMSVIILLAVGSDYNLLLVSRMKDEIGAGIKTGIIRAMGGTGKVVTNAGLVFAFTMMAMVVSDLRIIGQVGTTIGLGLLFDTLVVRSFMTPTIAALLGRWFWWPQRVRPRPASQLLWPIGPRPLVRSLLLPKAGDEDAPTTEIPRVSV
jgi:RND superfamily putative drug exporter